MATKLAFIIIMQSVGNVKSVITDFLKDSKN